MDSRCSGTDTGDRKTCFSAYHNWDWHLNPLMLNSLTPSAVSRHTPQRCIGGSSPQHCNAMQYTALHYNVAQAVIHAVKRGPAG